MRPPLAAHLAALVLFCLAVPQAGAVGTDRVAVVTMEPGRYSRQVVEKVKGFDTVTWIVPAEAGQSVSVTFETNHRQSHMDVFAPDGTKLHDGTRAGGSWSTLAPATGRYSARVMLARGAANRGEQATVRMTFAVTGEGGDGAPLLAAPAPPVAAPSAAVAAAPSPPPAGDLTAAPSTTLDPAVAEAIAKLGQNPAGATQATAAAPPAGAAAATDGGNEAVAKAVAAVADLKGAARFWAVTGVPERGLLPVYKEPGKEETRIGGLRHDAAGLKNLGCRMVSGVRWCRVVLAGQSERDGWVAGRYLRETSTTGPEEARGKPAPGVRPLRDIAGIVACAQGRDLTPTKVCEARVQRAAPGLAVVYVTLPDGAQRVLNFTSEGVQVTNPDLELTWESKGTMIEVTINGRERMVIPQQVVGGG